MTSSFFRFPHTPHLMWLGDGPVRGDKVLTPAEADEFLAHEVTVEEKVDGANVGLSIGPDGQVRAQNRGSVLERGACHPQFAPLFRWLDERRVQLLDVLVPETILFGEWCYATHSVTYTKLPDWFLAFDVYDQRAAAFWSMSRRDAHIEALGLARVPHVHRGRLTRRELPALLGDSQLTDGPAEGVYLKWSEGGDPRSRAKVVRPAFVQEIVEHWSARRLQPNRLRA